MAVPSESGEQSLLRPEVGESQTGSEVMPHDDQSAIPGVSLRAKAIGIAITVAVLGLVAFANLASPQTFSTSNHLDDGRVTLQVAFTVAATPSLFCYMVVQPFTEEVNMAQEMQPAVVGIFNCEFQQVFSTVEVGIPGFPTVILPTVTPVGKSIDDTSANSNIFLNVWNKIQEKGWHLEADWTVKADPDAVFVPQRLKALLAQPPANPYPPQYAVCPTCGTWVPNCDKYPGWHDNLWPMMWGALEILSRDAMTTYFTNMGLCQAQIDWMTLGEDTFMGKCMRLNKVNELFLKIQDQQCGVDTGVTSSPGWPSCQNQLQYVFHPHKDWADWIRCWTQTINNRP